MSASQLNKKTGSPVLLKVCLEIGVEVLKPPGEDSSAGYQCSPERTTSRLWEFFPRMVYCVGIFQLEKVVGGQMGKTFGSAETDQCNG